jgi:hypothetical protein
MRSEADEMSLTAFALGELEGDERAAVEARVAASADDRQYVEDVRAAANLVAAELGREPSVSLDAIHYAAIELRLRGDAGATHPPDRRAVVRGRIGLGLSIAASVAIVATALTFILATIHRHHETAINPISTEPSPTPILIPFQPLNVAEDSSPGHGIARPPAGAGPFVNAADHPLSSFAINTDTTSYEDLRKALFNDRLPARESVRIEGLINAFDYDSPKPIGAAPFAADVEVGPCPWTPGHQLARIGIKARDGTGTMAEDVRTEVQFNPAVTHSYRLIGYDAEPDEAPGKTSGETIAAGRMVTVLYEIAPVVAASEKNSQGIAAPANPLTLRVRYRDPGQAAEQVAEFVGHPAANNAPSTDFQFASAVAELGMLLRDSPDRGSASVASVIALAQTARGPDPHGQRQQFIELARRAKDLLG